MDQIDVAQRVEEELRLEGLLKLRALHTDEEAQLVDPHRGQILCLDCEAPIPKARLAANPKAVRCIECQREQDRIVRHENRLYAGSDHREEPSAAIFRAARGAGTAQPDTMGSFEDGGDSGGFTPGAPPAAAPRGGTETPSERPEAAARGHLSGSGQPLPQFLDDLLDDA